MSVLFTVLVLAVLLFLLGVSYRRILGLRVLVGNAWKKLDEQLKRRRDVVAKNLAVARASGIDGATLDRVAAALTRASAYRGPGDAGRKNVALDAAIGELVSLIGQQDSTNDTRGAMRAELIAATRAVSGNRRSYNTVAGTYNGAIGVVPGNLIAGIGGFRRAELFLP